MVREGFGNSIRKFMWSGKALVILYGNLCGPGRIWSFYTQIHGIPQGCFRVSDLCLKFDFWRGAKFAIDSINGFFKDDEKLQLKGGGSF